MCRLASNYMHCVWTRAKRLFIDCRWPSILDITCWHLHARTCTSGCHRRTSRKRRPRTHPIIMYRSQAKITHNFALAVEPTLLTFYVFHQVSIVSQMAFAPRVLELTSLVLIHAYFRIIIFNLSRIIIYLCYFSHRRCVNILISQHSLVILYSHIK